VTSSPSKVRAGLCWAAQLRQSVAAAAAVDIVNSTTTTLIRLRVSPPPLLISLVVIGVQYGIVIITRYRSTADASNGTLLFLSIMAV